MKIFYYVIFLLLSPFAIVSQSPLNWNWVESSGGSALSNATGVATDSSGNVFVTGYFQGNSFIVFGTDTLYHVYPSDFNFFIVKYSSSGIVLWAKTATMPDTGSVYSNNIAIDAGGNAYITGAYFGNQVSIGASVLPSTALYNYNNSFIAKYDAAGNVLWAKASIASPGQSDNYGNGIAIDRHGNSYSTGNFNSASISFGGNTIFNSDGFQTLYIVKYNSMGNVLWAKSANGDAESFAIAVDANNNAYITGVFSYYDSVSFDNISVYANYTNASNYFIAKYDSSGNAVWAKGASGNAVCEGLGLATDRNNNIYTTGYFNNGTLNFGGGVTLQNSIGNASSFIVKYNDSGNAIWGKSPAENLLTSGQNIATDFANNIYATGKFFGSISFDSIALLAPANDFSPVYIFAFDSSGEVVCASYLSDGGDEAKGGICVDKNGNGYITSAFERNPFIVGSDTLLLTGGHSTDNVYLAKFMCANCANNDTFTYQLTPAALCPGDSAGISFSTAGIIITPANAVTWLNAQQAILKPDTTTVFTISGVLPCGIQHTQSFTLPVMSPTVTIAANKNFICFGDSIQICATPGYNTYTWSPAAGGLATSCIEAKNTGAYTVSVTANNGACTAHSNTLNISVDHPQVTIGAFPDTICAGDSARICATANFTSYSWSNNSSAHCIETQNAGAYFLMVTDSNACTAQSNTVHIIAGQATPVTISASPDTICSGDSAQICPTGNFVIYAWSPASGGASTQCIETQNTGVYTLTVTDNQGCTAQSNSLSIYAGQAPTATVSANKDTICPGDSAQLCATGNFSQYIWSNHAQTLCMETQTPGTYFLRAAGANGCSVQSNSVIISAGQAPSVTISANADSICSGDSAQICATQGFASYAWNPAIGGATGNCIQVHSPGAYSVAVSGNSGCTAQSNPISIAVLQRPTINIAATSDSICTGDSARLCATPGFVMYVWSPPAAAGQGACIESFNTGTYNVTVTDNHNCTAQSNTVNITVGNTLSVAIAATADSICTGDTAKICASFGFATYAWNAATGGTTGNCINTASAGNYYVSVSDNSGCSAQSNTISITALNAPTAIVTANPPSFCPGSSAQICATAGYALYRWTYNNNNSNCIEVQRADNYAVTVTDNNGCTAASNPISISLQSAPSVTITAQPENICPGDSSKICAPQGLEAYLWSTNATGNCIHTASAGNYNLTVTDNNGCTALSNHITINIYPKPSVTIATNIDTICPGDSTKICAPSTLTFTTYLWNPPAAAGQGACIEAQNAGDYYVTVTDNVGCTAESNHVGITTLPSPQVSISRIGDTLIANNAIGCQWYFNDAIIQGATRN